MIWKYLYNFCHVLVYIIAKLFFRYRALGTEHISKKGSAILASNHASYLDPFFVGMGIWRRINYLAKKELFCNKLIAYLLKKIFRIIPIDREQIDRSTLRIIYRLLRSKEIMLLFPEGTRTYDGELMEPKLGIGMIAYNTRVPVIPVYVNGSFKIWSRKSTRIHISPCSVFYGPPVDLESYYSREKSRELYKEMSEKIMEGIRELKDGSQGLGGKGYLR